MVRTLDLEASTTLCKHAEAAPTVIAFTSRRNPPLALWVWVVVQCRDSRCRFSDSLCPLNFDYEVVNHVVGVGGVQCTGVIHQFSVVLNAGVVMAVVSNTPCHVRAPRMISL
jgi:hypothetical protein